VRFNRGDVVYLRSRDQSKLARAFEAGWVVRYALPNDAYVIVHLTGAEKRVNGRELWKPDKPLPLPAATREQYESLLHNDLNLVYPPVLTRGQVAFQNQREHVSATPSVAPSAPALPLRDIMSRSMDKSTNESISIVPAEPARVKDGLPVPKSAPQRFRYRSPTILADLLRDTLQTMKAKPNFSVARFRKSVSDLVGPGSPFVSLESSHRHGAEVSKCETRQDLVQLVSKWVDNFKSEFPEETREYIM
jgi:hypothetical protein